MRQIRRCLSSNGPRRVEAPQAPRGWGVGGGVLLPLGRGSALPRKKSIFGLQRATFGALWGLFYGSVDCFGQPLHDSIMSVTVTGVIAGS